MPFGAPCHYARHYARAPLSPGHAKADFRCVWFAGGYKFRQFLDSAGKIVKPAVRVTGSQDRR